MEKKGKCTAVWWKNLLLNILNAEMAYSNNIGIGVMKLVALVFLKCLLNCSVNYIRKWMAGFIIIKTI